MKFISIIVLICFIFTNIPIKGYADTVNSYSLRRRAAINNESVEMQIAARIINLSSFLENIGLKDINSIAANIALQLPKNIAVKELSFIVCQDGLWVIGPEQENYPQVFIRLSADGKTGLSVTKTTVPAAEPSRKRQTLLQIVSKLITEKKTIAEGLTYDQPAYVITPLMERMIFGAKLEKEFLEGFAKQEKKAMEEYPELAALINHMKNPESGPYEFIITPELAKKWNLKDGLAKELTKMAPIATAGMRSSQNPLFPGDLSLPMNILLTLLLTNELAEMSGQAAKAQGTISPEAIVGGEVRYNTPLVNEMLRRRFAKLGITVHSPPRGVYLPIGATSYITTVLNIMFTIYDTASHSPRGTYASKLMGNLKAPISPFMEANLKELGIDPEEYRKSRSEGAQLLIEDMKALAERIEKKIDNIFQGEALSIKFSGGADEHIRFDIENPSVAGNINVIDRYAKYLKSAYVTEKNIEIVKQALNDGLKMGFDQARGAAYKFFKGVYEGVFGKEVVEKINWTGTTSDSFFGDTGMTDFNQKQPPDEFVKRYVKAVLKGLDANFSSALVGTTSLARISEQDLCRVIKEEPRKGKEKDTVTIRFKIFAKEEEGMLKRLGMSYHMLSSGKILGFYRPKISDISEDVSLLEVVAASKLPAFMLSKPVGYVYPTTDPDGDRFVMMQVEKNDPATKARLEHLNVGYLVLSEEKLLVVYVPNQNFLQTQNAYIDQLKDENKFLQQIEDPDAVTFFAIKTTVSSETWVVLYTSEGIPVVQIPVGFKEIGAIMRKVEFQIMLNKIRKQLGLKPRMVVVHDIFGQAVKLGYNPRLLFAGEESGGMVQGSLELLSTEDNLRSYLSWREKNAVEASVCNTIMICRKFNQAIESALSRGVKKDNVYEDKQFLEDISLSKILEQLYEQKRMKNTAELRTDIVLVDPLTSSQATKDVRDKMDKEGYYRRDVNSGFFLSLAFGLQDGYITLNDVKAILKEVLLADKEMVKKVISVTDNTAPDILLKQIDDLQRCLFVGDAVYLGFSNGAWEIVRPSGTDTKIKSYPSSANSVVSAVMSNAIGEVYPKIFFELAEGRVAPDMPATAAYVRSLRQKDPVLINVDAIQKRQQEQYQRGLKVDTMPDWFIDPGIQKLLAERFPEYTQDGEKVSSVHVFLGPVSQKEELRYDPESHIIYASWDFDAQMQAAENKAGLLEKTLDTYSIVAMAEKSGIDLGKATYTGHSCKDVLSIIQKDPALEYAFFDIDDTLVNAESVAKLYVQAAQKNGVVISAEAIRKYIGVVRFGDPEEAMEIFSQFGVNNKEIVERIINDYNQIFEEALNTGYFKDFLYEDVKEVFSELKKRGIKIGIITNRYEQLALKQMESMGILEYVTQSPAFKRTKGYAVLGGDSAELFQEDGLIATRKGKGALLELSTKIFNINSPKACLMVGDMDADIKAGQLNNMPSFLVVRNESSEQVKKPIFTAEELALLDAVKKAQDALPNDVNEQNLNFIVQVDKEGNLIYPLSPEAKIMIGHIRDDRAAYFARGLQKRGFKNLIGYIKFAKDFEGKYVLPEEIIAEVPNTFFERLSNKRYTSVKISEDEKKSHTADNANGRRKSPFKGERRIVIKMQDSKKAYVDTPQMKMEECANAVLNELDGDVDFILVNFLSSDMMKHTGSFEASVKGNQITDSQLGRIKEKIDAIKQNIVKLVESEVTNIETGNELKELLNDDYDKFLERLKTVDENIYNNVRNLEARIPMLVVTADHGASEDGLKANQKESDTFHTANPVPYIIYDPLRKKKIPLKSDKTIINNAATLLHLLGEEIPSDYEESLLPSDYKGSKRRIVFCVLDGWGINPDRNYPYDAIRLAKVPIYNWLVENASFTKLKAHGEVIGLRSQLSYEEGPHHLKGLQAGQTDIGHLHLFSGRQIKQPLWYVDNLIKGKINEGVFDESKPEIKVLIDELNEAKDKNLKVFYIAVASEGGVHSSLYHMYALMRLAKKLDLKKDQFIIIPAADGRDVPSRTADLYLQDIFIKIKEIGIGVVSGVFGRDMLVRKEGMEDITNRIIDVFSGNELDKSDVIRVKPADKLGNDNVKEGSKELGIDAKDFLDANSRFFKAVGGEALLPGYLEDILSQYKVLFHLDDVKLALVIHSSFFKKGGAIEALNKIIKLQPGQIMLGIYGEGGDKIRALFSDSSNVITAKTADELKSKLKNQKGELPMDVVVLKPIGEKIGWEVKQVGFSEKTISTVAVAKAMQVLLGANSEGQSYSGVILNRFKEFYENMESRKVISNETYEKTKAQVFDGLDLPNIELAQGINGINNNDADVISKFIDSFI